MRPYRTGIRDTGSLRSTAGQAEYATHAFDKIHHGPDAVGFSPGL